MANLVAIHNPVGWAMTRGRGVSSRGVRPKRAGGGGVVGEVRPIGAMFGFADP